MPNSYYISYFERKEDILTASLHHPSQTFQICRKFNSEGRVSFQLTTRITKRRQEIGSEELTKGVQPKTHRTHHRNNLSTAIRSTQYGGYDTPLVIEWARVRIPNKAWMYLQVKNSDFRLKWIPVSNGKQCTPTVLCWDHRL
ncbi:hypothetical protein TNCV_312681 [Trichonephila clavipes]|nr:hypothetical protein TNCV_312681 [Trichonephila clavipes]